MDRSSCFFAHVAPGKVPENRIAGALDGMLTVPAPIEAR